MRKSRFSEEQIIGILKEVESSRAVKDRCRVATSSPRCSE